MIEARIDTYTEHLLFVEEPAKNKPIEGAACMACGTEEIVSLSSFDPDELDDRMVGPTGLALATGAIGASWFQSPGGAGTLRTDQRSKSLPLDQIILGATTVIMLGTITFILGWDIGLIAAAVWGAKSYRERLYKSHIQLAKSDRDRQRLWDKYSENEVLEKRRTLWTHLGYCKQCGTVHDLIRRKCTSWYNMLELYDDIKSKSA